MANELVTHQWAVLTFDSRQKSTNAELRCASLWCIINLGHLDRNIIGSGSGGRRPREIVDKLRALSVEDELRRMTSDPDLDVRERVRDALHVFDGGQGQYYAAPMATV